MNRYWTALPIVVMAGVPVWTAPSVPVIVIEAAACLLCALGVFGKVLTPVTTGGGLAIIGYAFALCSASSGVDVVGAAAFGLALLYLLDLSEFARRLRGAEITAAVMQGQAAYWLGRAALIAGAVALMALCASALALIVPAAARAIVAGVGAVIAFAGALRAGIVRAEAEDG